MADKSLLQQQKSFFLGQCASLFLCDYCFLFPSAHTQPKGIASLLPQISVCSPLSGHVRQFKVNCSLNVAATAVACRWSLHCPHYHCKLRQMLGFATIQISLFEAAAATKAHKGTQTTLTESVAVNFRASDAANYHTTTSTSARIK